MKNIINKLRAVGELGLTTIITTGIIGGAALVWATHYFSSEYKKKQEQYNEQAGTIWRTNKEIARLNPKDPDYEETMSRLNANIDEAAQKIEKIEASPIMRFGYFIGGKDPQKLLTIRKALPNQSQQEQYQKSELEPPTDSQFQNPPQK